jgi:hypothetical protein
MQVSLTPAANKFMSQLLARGYNDPAKVVEIALERLAQEDVDSVSEEQHSAEADAETLALFLDLVSNDIKTHPETVEPYTEAMSDEDDDLLSGVVVAS